MELKRQNGTAIREITWMLIEKALLHGVLCVLLSYLQTGEHFPGMKPGYCLRLLKAVLNKHCLPLPQGGWANQESYRCSHHS